MDTVYSTAYRIAEQHLKAANPSGWGGSGERPVGFDARIGTYPMKDGYEVDISFEQDSTGKWMHLCELRDSASEELLDVQSGERIDSTDAIADTLTELCGSLLE